MDGRARLAALAVAALAAAAMKLLDRGTLLRTLAAVPATLVATPRAAHAMAPGFKRANPIQFIAALGDPGASSGKGTEEWGLWTVDPGPRGVMLKNFQSLEANGGVARAGWKFDKENWWLEEHGLIMEAPDFPMPSGRYLVTGGRETTTVLTVDNGKWALDSGKLYDVTHLPCRAARYSGGSPAQARQSDFPVTPGAAMPPVSGTKKQDYAVLFIVGVEA